MTCPEMKTEKKLKQSLRLLEKHLDKKDCKTFLAGDPVNLIINHDLYTLHKLDDGTVEIRQEGRSSPGYIKQYALPDLYDSVVAFITNVRYVGVDWGCGNMSLKLPDTMPPRDLSFISYLSESTPGAFDALKTVIKVLGGILVFPYWMGRVISECSSTLGYLFVVGSCTFICSSLAFFIAKPHADALFNFNTFILVASYLIIPGYVGAISGRYMNWRAKWEVKDK